MKDSKKNPELIFDFGVDFGTITKHDISSLPEKAELSPVEILEREESQKFNVLISD